MKTLLRRKHDLKTSERSIRDQLHAFGLRLETVSLHAESSSTAVKQQRIRNAVNDLPAGTAVLFEDETEVTLIPPLRAGWTKKGEPAEVTISGGNAKRMVFGTISLTGHRLFLVRRKQRSEDFRQFLHLVGEHYRGRPVFMLLDGDSSHTAGASEALAKELEIHLEWLPVRSPELNAIEDLWGKAKDAVCANHQYADMQTQADQFIDYAQSLTNHESKRVARLLSDDYWLFH